MKRIRVLALGLVGFALVARAGHAYEEETHRLINRASADTVLFDALLRNQLGLVRGLQERFSGKVVIEWIGDGGRLEDQTTRPLRHFHDPLKSWDQAGLRLGPLLFESSILWMQRADQDAQVPMTGDWGWPTARQHYATGLKATNPAERDRAWGDTFRALGQIMHLPADASVPEHTRNTPHPSFEVFGYRLFGSYEHFVETLQGVPGSAQEGQFIATYLANPKGFDPVILHEPMSDPAAPPVPIARLLDTDKYTGADPNVTLEPTPDRPAIGVTEFANANFFTTQTAGASSPYPFPDFVNLQPSVHPAPKTGRIRSYYKKRAGDGLAVDPVLAECILDEAALDDGVPRTAFCARDEKIWQQVATHMLPRAVGYARGVLDYFFRGQLEIAAPDQFVYARAREGGQFVELKAKVRNVTRAVTPAGEVTETVPAGGTLRAVLRYRRLVLTLPFPGAPLTLSQEVYAVVSDPVTLSAPLTEAFREFTFTFSAGQGLPIWAADVWLQVVYEGQLGLEPSSIAVGSKDLFEPDLVDYVNGTDWECVAGRTPVYYVADLSTYRPYPPGGYEPSRDVDGDGDVDLFGPAIERSLRLRAFPLATPGVLPPLDQTPWPTVTAFELYLPEIRFAEWGRVAVLQDADWYGLSLESAETEDVPTGLRRGQRRKVFGFGGIRNALVRLPSGEVVIQLTTTATYRGTVGYRQIVLLNDQAIPCLGATVSLNPPVRLIPVPPAEVPGSGP